MPYDIKTSFIASQITSITGTTANFSSTTASTSNTTGSLTTSGGLGISNTMDATSSTNGGTITTAGGLAVAKKAYIGTDLFVTGNVGIGTTSTANKVVVSGGGISQLQNINSAASQLYVQNSNSGINAYSVLTVASDTANLNLIVNSSTRTSADSGASAATVRNDNGTLTLGWTGYNTIFPGNVVMSNTTTSTSNTTGIITLAGGLGISNTTDAISSTNGGTITTSGGLAVAKKAFIGTDLSVGGTTNLANLTLSTALALDASKNIISVTNTGTGNNVLQANPTITGTLTTSAISATSGTFSSTLGVTGLVTASGGLTSTSGTTTLGASTIGAITGTSASFSSTLGVTGLITANGGVSIPSSSNDQGSTFFLRNSNAGSGAYSQFSIGNDSVSTFNILLNSSTRTAEGGINTATIRNDAGILRLQSNSGIGVIINTSGNVDIGSTTASTSNTTGGLTAAGGLGISNTTDATSSTNGGSITTAGGLAVAKKAYIGTDLAVGGTTNLANLTLSTALALDSSKNVISVTNTGTGNNVLQANPTITGTLTTSAISATSGTFSTTLGVTGLATFGAGGLTSTAGTTTLGVSTIGAITGTSASFNTTLGVTGLITANGGVSIPSSSNDQGSTFFLRNSNAGSGAYSQFSIGNDGVSTFNILLNSSTRTAEGGINTATIRNDAGILRLQSNSGIGVNINTSGNVDIGSTTSSTSNTTGGLTLAGGLGISNTTDAISSTNGGSITTAGGLAVAKKAFIGTNTDTASINIRSTGGTYQAGSIYSDSGWGMLFRSAVNSPSLATFRFGRFDDTALLFMYDNGLVHIPGTTTSTSNSTGTLTLGGGLGISNTTDATSSTNGGSITTAGGLAVSKKAFIGTNLTAGSVTISGTNLVDKTISGNINWGFIFTADPALGGSYLFASANAGTNYIEINSSKTLRVYGNIGIDSTTASSSNTTGAITTAGGLGISNTTDATSSTNGGSITTAGGLAVAKKAYFGSDLIAGSIQSTNFSSISTQGGYLQWNRTGIEGETWLINTTIGTNPGIRFGKSTLANSVTELMRISDNGNVNITTSISSTSNTTGSLTLTGGLGISNTNDATSSTNGGSITTAGGLAVAKKAFIGTDLVVGGNTVRNAQLVGLTITSLQLLPTVVNWDSTYTGTLANMSLSQSSGVFTYSGANPSTLYLNIGVYLTGFTDGAITIEISLNGSILTRHTQYCVNGSTAMANTVINVSNTNTFQVYVNSGTGNANNSGSSYTWLRISQI